MRSEDDADGHLQSTDGSPVTIDEIRVLRIRETISGEEGRTRIDWTMMSLVMEPIDQVVTEVRAKLASLTCLKDLAHKKVWFDAHQAVGGAPVGNT
jgi:hypothetical protein